MKKTSKLPGKRWIILAVAVLIVAAVVVLVLPRLRSRANAGATSTYRTETLQTGSLTSYVGASGNVYTNQSATLSWDSGGVVGQVHVSKGQAVSKEDVLAELDPSSLPQTIINAQVDLASAKQALDDLLNSTTPRANAELALIKAEQDLVSAQKAAQSKQFQRASQETIDIAQAQLILAQNSLDKAADIYNKNKNRSSTDVEYANALSQFAAAQQKFDQAQNNLYYVQALPDPMDVQEANANVDVAQAAYLDAKRAWERVKDGPNPDDVAAAQAKVDAAQATIDSAKITAPFNGTIMEIDTKPGDVVSAQTAAFVLDDVSHIFTDIQVSEVDINSVKLGQPVEVTLDAIPDKTYQGTVTDIDTSGTISSGAVNFNVTVEINSKDPQIKPGMTTSANIAVTQLEGVLLVPNSALRTVNNRQVVYVLQNGVARPEPVTLGAASATSSQVVGGNLKEGDQIILNPPSDTTLTSSARPGGLFGGLFGGPRISVGGEFNGGGNNRSSGSNSGNRVVNPNQGGASQP